MLEIRIHHTNDCGIGILPPMKNRAGQTALPFAHQQTNARISLAIVGDDFCSAVATVVIHNQDFVVDVERIQNARAPDQAAPEYCPLRTASVWPGPASAESEA